MNNDDWAQRVIEKQKRDVEGIPQYFLDLYAGKVLASPPQEKKETKDDKK